MTDHLPLLVLDKSYAQAVPAAELMRLDKRYVVLIPDAFYYEVFRNNPQKRRHALKGFPEFRRIHLPAILRSETRDGKPVMESDYPRLEFDAKVLEPDWKMTREHENVMADYQKSFLDRSVAFWMETMNGPVPGFTESENASLKLDRAFLELCQDLRNPARVISVAKNVGYQHAERLDPSWFHFRFYQTMAFQALVLRWRLKGSTGDANPVRLKERLEHDALDLEYLLIGLIVRRLATAETSQKLAKASMGWRFKLLEPQSYLLSP